METCLISALERRILKRHLENLRGVFYFSENFVFILIHILHFLPYFTLRFLKYLTVHLLKLHGLGVLTYMHVLPLFRLVNSVMDRHALAVLQDTIVQL